MNLATLIIAACCAAFGSTADTSIGDALVILVEAGELEHIEIALSSGCDVDTVNRNQATPTLAAAALNQTEILKLLLAEGADPNIPNAKGVTPLYVASMVGHTEVVAVLLENGADPNIKMDAYVPTPLASAVINGRAEIVRLLLDHGADTSISAIGEMSVNDLEADILHLLNEADSSE